MKCYSRSEMLHAGPWVYIQCKKCGEVKDIRNGIEWVVGRVSDKRFQNEGNGKLYLGLWNEKQKDARFAEIDELEIQAGKKIGYDWAVNAVIENLRNGWEGELKLPITIQEGVTLDPNTMRNIEEANRFL